MITKDGEGKLNKSQEKKEDRTEVKSDTGETKTYLPAEISDGAGAGQNLK